MKLLLTDQAPFTFAAPGVEVVRFDPRVPLPPEHLDAEVAVVTGGGSPVVDQLVTDAPALRYLQTLAAGPDYVIRAGFPESVQIAVGRGFHDLPVAEHAVALTLTALGRFDALREAQREHRWAEREFGGWRQLRDDRRLTSVIDANVLVWGFGSIGLQVATVFTALGANVMGIARSEGVREGYEVFTTDDLFGLLPHADIVVMVLPASDETHHALDAELLNQLRPTAWIVNVGRGTTIDEAALVAALREGRIGGAALDVTETEPLPADSPLWDCPNVLITPHMAGGRPLGVPLLLERNLAHLAAGEPLENLLER